MVTIDEQVEQLFSECPLLADDKFTARYPGIGNVATYLDSTAKVTHRIGKRFEAYEKIGAKDTPEFIELLNRNDEKAARLYQNIKRILCF